MAINVNNQNNNLVNPKQVEQQRNAQVQQQNAGPAGQAQQAAAAPRQDSVSLTNAAQQMNQATNKAKSASGFDQEKVDRIKKAISDGDYKVDPQKLAASITAAEGKLFGL